MRSRAPRSRRRVWTLGLLTMLLVATLQTAAWAQLTIQPTVTPTRDTGGWVYWMAEAAIGLSAAVVLLMAAAYLRFAPRFYRSDREEEAKQPPMAPPADAIRLQYRPPPAVAAPAPEPAAVGAPAAAPATAPAAAPAPKPAAAPAAAPASGAPAPAAAPRPAAPRQEGPLELDQETFDRVLKEQLDKGTDRRVAEGRARSAAVKAAREKAGG